MSAITIREGLFEPHGKSVFISNGIVEAAVLIEHGPRVISYGFVGGRNQFCTDSGIELDVDGEMWRLFGGHRLWLTSEEFPRTYIPDNQPVEWEKIPGGIRVTSVVQPTVLFQKQLEITMGEEDSRVHVKSRLINKNVWPVKTAVWSASVMKKGGVEFIPQLRLNSTFLDGATNMRTLVIWPYAPMNDPRITWGDKYVFLTTDSSRDNDVKFGFSNVHGWAAYLNEGELFLKQHPVIEGAEYPDCGGAYVTYTCKTMLEMETFSPVTEIAPNGVLEHYEDWTLLKCDEKLEAGDEAKANELTEKYLAPYIK